LEAINGANDVEFSFPYEWHGQYLNQSSRAFFCHPALPFVLCHDGTGLRCERAEVQIVEG
jgi:hypothetical protein